MHKKYAKDGLVCISLNIDDKDDHEKALAFLKKVDATFTNFLLDEPGEVRDAKFDNAAPPTVHVYGKNGKRVKRFTTEEPFTYEDVEKVVAGLLK
jgi:hypothetical protein